MDIPNFVIANWIEIVGAILGLLYLYFEYKANILMWPIGIAMSSFYIYVYIQSTFYAFACINIYYIITGIYGWYKWYISSKDNENISYENNLRKTPTLLYLPILIVTVFIFALVYYVLKTYTNSHVIAGDAIITTLSIVAMLMLVYRYVEQWLLLITVNIISVYVYYNQNLIPTTIMYLVFSIVSIFGYVRWKNLIKDQK